MVEKASNGVKTIAVIFGGRSAEHDVSIITAHIPIIQSLQASGQFDVWPIYISKNGKWYADKAMNDFAFFKRPDFESILSRQKPVRLSFENGLGISWPGVLSKSVRIDVVFPSMHGTYGEYGSLMGLLRMAGVPFAGGDMFASAVAMDKAFTKQVLFAEGISVVPFCWFTRAQWETENVQIKKRIAELSWPVFVKPVHLGSSIGITKVKKESELENAIEVALHYDDKVLVEESVEELTEVTLPIMGNDIVQTAEVERPLNKAEFFDFKDKYLSGGKGGKSADGALYKYSEIPADIGAEMTASVKELGARVYRVLGCSGTARVDFLIDNRSGRLYVNEVNTLPGTLYQHNWKKAGVSNMDLVLKLVALAEERFESQKNTTRAFNSDILSKIRGPKAQ